MTFAKNFSKEHLFVVVVLLVALTLRMVIVARGGSYYWADELRYEAARKACAAVGEGKFENASRAMFSTSGHIGFRFLALVPALAERAILGAKVYDARICAGFFALFGVVNLFLVWRIARRFAPGRWEPALALVFAACSNSLFYHARHCFPYDASLTFLLLAVHVSGGPTRPRQPWLVGLCCGLGYLIYNGYWSLAVVVWVMDVVWRRERMIDRARRALQSGAGLLAPIVVVFALARWAGYDLVADSIGFADTVNQGDFGDGWRFPAEYLRIADGALWMLLGVLVAIAVVRCAARPEYQAWLRWVVALVLLYVIWVSFCDVVPKFVLYGRTVRAAVPFLALGAAGAFEYLRRSGGRAPAVLLVAVAAVAGASGLAKMAAPLQQMFPREFRQLAARMTAEVKQRDPDARLQVLFAEYPTSPNFPEEPPPYRELLRRPHPHQYLPYLYDGYTRAQRPLYHERDIAMRLIQLDTSRGLHVLKRSERSQWAAPYSGGVSLLVRLPDNRIGQAESLLVAGDDLGRAPRVVVQYADRQHVRVGFTRGSATGELSKPIACDYEMEHAIAVSLGAFYPETNDPRFDGRSELKTLCREAVILFDGQPVLRTPAEFTPVPLQKLRLGSTLPVDGAGASGFSGKIFSLRQVDSRLFLEDAKPRFTTISGPFFGEYHGALEIRLRFPRDAAEHAEPLLATGRTGAGDVLFVTYLADGRVRLNVDHWGAPAVVSQPLEVDRSALHRLVVSFGSLFPAADDPRFREAPTLRKLTQWLYVSLDDRVVFSRPFEFYAAEPDAVLLGGNLPGGTACAEAFSGEILEARHVPPAILFPDGATPGER